MKSVFSLVKFRLLVNVFSVRMCPDLPCNGVGPPQGKNSKSQKKNKKVNTEGDYVYGPHVNGFFPHAARFERGAVWPDSHKRSQWNSDRSIRISGFGSDCKTH